METTGKTCTGTAPTGTDEALWRLKLMTWLSPSFPVGGFAFSGGLEWVVEAGDVADVTGLAGWLRDLLHHGAARADAVLLAAAWRGSAVAINELALALAPSAERRLETAAQGTAFFAAVTAAWPATGLAELNEVMAGEDLAYPVAIGMAARCHALPLRPTLEAFLLAGAANLVSAATRLAVVGQAQAQAVIAGLAPSVASLARWAETSTLDDLGTSAWCADIASMRHETQYSRLFRS